MVGGAGNDVLIGDGDDDHFVFETGNGIDTVTDFQAGRRGGDVIDLSSWGFTSIDDLLITNDRAGTHIHLDGDRAGHDKVILLGVGANALHADDFIFS
ncbi:MAG: hypothetical protein EXQ89_05295 [Rhodospirillaceae bacterium]|nr:hypothetical protein [Rhodospirillaceae bacterium]